MVSMLQKLTHCEYFYDLFFEVCKISPSLSQIITDDGKWISADKTFRSSVARRQGTSRTVSGKQGNAAHFANFQNVSQDLMCDCGTCYLL